MTLAGFRPALKSEYEEYEFHHRARIAMKPGITGMWQVSGRSDITDFEEVVKLDTEYIKKPILVLCWGMIAWDIDAFLVKRVKKNLEIIDLPETEELEIKIGDTGDE